MRHERIAEYGPRWGGDGQALTPLDTSKTYDTQVDPLNGDIGLIRTIGSEGERGTVVHVEGHIGEGSDLPVGAGTLSLNCSAFLDSATTADDGNSTGSLLGIFHGNMTGSPGAVLLIVAGTISTEIDTTPFDYQAWFWMPTHSPASGGIMLPLPPKIALSMGDLSNVFTDGKNFIDKVTILG